MRKLILAIAPCVVLLMSAGAAQASVRISADATKNMSCSAGVCSPTAKEAVLNVNDLTSMLASGDVKITTGNGAVTIMVLAPFSWTSTSRLTLDAMQNVSFRAPVTVAGTGAVTITTNDGGTGGDLIFFPGASLSFWGNSSDLTINGINYKLESSVSALADAIAANPHGAFALANDYDATTSSPYGAPPIPTPLAGSFEGLGHAISNLDIEPKDHPHQHFPQVGLFIAIAAGATVRDISILNGKIATGAVEVSAGLLAADSAGLILNSFSAGSVAIGYYTRGSGGGLVGSNSGTIARSHADVSITGGPLGENITGGLVGYSSGTIEDCYATGSGGFGGLVGENHGLFGDAGLITRSHASGSAIYGGLVKDNLGGKITYSYASGDVLQGGGGLVYQTGGDGALIDSSFGTGQVTA